MGVFTCDHCAAQFRHYVNLIAHFEQEHSADPRLQLQCLVKGCLSSYSNVGSLRSHIYRKHKLEHDKFMKIPVENLEDTPVGSEPSEHQVSGNEDSAVSNQNCFGCSASSDGSDDNRVDFERYLVRSTLKIKRQFNIPDKAIEQIIQSYTVMLQLCKQKTIEASENNKDIMEPLNQLLNAHENNNTSHKFKNNIKTEGYVEPIEVSLGGEGKYVYVPILNTLRNLLRHDDVLSHVVREKSQETENCIQSYTDSMAFKENAFFKENPRALRLKLYTDEFQVVNPLGNKTKKHKICAVYFTLDNLPIEYQSKVYTIQLALLCRSEVLKEFGFGLILNRLVEDIKILETEGIIVSATTYGSITLLGSVSVVIADNLGAHDIGGYLLSFTANRVCRFCDATKVTRVQSFNEASFTLSGRESYDAKASYVEQDSRLSTCYGLRNSSALNELHHYHVAMGLPSDIAHDIFEGFNIDLLENLLNHCLEQKYFSSSFLNEAIMNFPYKCADKTNKPGPVSSVSVHKVKIKQTAAQSLCLVRLLPLIIGKHIPEDDYQWVLYVRFLKCLDLILAPKLNEGEIHLMSEEITCFLTDFFRANEQLSVKPKSHFLIHYATQYKRFGPLINNMTLRYESKHAYMKSTVSTSKNYRNVCLSIAQRHQFDQVYHHMVENYLPSDFPSFTKICAAPLLNNDEIEATKSVIADPSSVQFSRSVSVHGITYTDDHCVLIKFDREFVFGKIKYCTLHRGSVYFLANILSTLHYENHLNAYVLESTTECDLFTIDDLLSVFPLPLYECGKYENTTYVAIMKHFVPII